MDEHRHAVVVVEDDPGTREAIEALLTIHGCRVTAVEDAELALDAVDRDPGCCVVLLDWHMPGLGGEGFLRRRRHMPSVANLPVVIVTGDELTGAEVQAAGASAFLRKPMDPAILLGVVARQCRAHGVVEELLK
jgi:two-component system chemotaxis response regulator CheY